MLAVLLVGLMPLTGCGGGGTASSSPAIGVSDGTDGSSGAGSASTADAGGSSGAGSSPGGGASGATVGGVGSAATMTARDANRLAHQATFGPTESLLAQMQTQSAEQWVAAQLTSKVSRYTSGRGDAVHRNTQAAFFCDLPAYAGANCWRDWFSTEPLNWDFYRNAVNNPDQLRQRVAWALSQVLVVSSRSVGGTYGFRNYHNMMLENAFGNYRELLRRVALSPVMGEFLNNVNNDAAAPNENFARELLQLFSIGTCRLDSGGAFEGGKCQPNYGNAEVRNYAYALTGWTYPPGGSTSWGCWPQGTNCPYMDGDMVASPAAYRDPAARSLLGGVTVPAGSTAPQALERVLDSLMAHPSMAPFMSRQIIQHLVTSNPSAAYVARVAEAFKAGKYRSFGAGQTGDMAATVAATLLDAEARAESPPRSFGRLREPAQMFTGVLRALGGRTDGSILGGWWGTALSQQAFEPPSVFSYYPPDYPVPGSSLVGPAFGIHNASAAITRLNFLAHLIDFGGSAPDPSVPSAVGTRVDLTPFIADAADSTVVVDRMSRLALGTTLPAAARAKVIEGVDAVSASTAGSDWKAVRARTAAFLVFGSPQYHIVR